MSGQVRLPTYSVGHFERRLLKRKLSLRWLARPERVTHTPHVFALGGGNRFAIPSFEALRGGNESLSR